MITTTTTTTGNHIDVREAAAAWDAMSQRWARDAETARRQQQSRDAFDLDAAMAALPPAGPALPTSERGAAGVRLRGYLVADISDALLREFARDTLGAQRCSEQYLDALRVVLGNQADAERHGYVLEMNQRVIFAPARVMRTIIDQMHAAGITFGRVVRLGECRSQLVQCYVSRGGQATMDDNTPAADAAAELESMYRREEAQNDARQREAAQRGQLPTDAADPWPFISDDDVPY